MSTKWIGTALLAGMLLVLSPALGHGYREKGKPVAVAGAAMIVTPVRDWNQLSGKPGKKAEIWTLDGEQLNAVTWYGAITPGEPLIREASKKRKPLPKFALETLLVELPELLEATYRSARDIGTFTVTSTEPDRFLGQSAVRFTYDYVDENDLPHRGEARATIAKGQLYMVTFDAPRLHFFESSLQDFRQLCDSAKLP
ncbi:MAG: hypothetical protein A4S12_11265 [Proteobacteria bacterium SG_bin5]|nr:MAG: hypothetical protein A4S12_11265 [Proteobacteria bacterium SG_bin5]